MQFYYRNLDDENYVPGAIILDDVDALKRFLKSQAVVKATFQVSDDNLPPLYYEKIEVEPSTLVMAKGSCFVLNNFISKYISMSEDDLTQDDIENLGLSERLDDDDYYYLNPKSISGGFCDYDCVLETIKDMFLENRQFYPTVIFNIKFGKELTIK